MTAKQRLQSAVDGPVRHLVLILGDQLDRRARCLRELDPLRDAVLMMEVDAEASGSGAGIRSHKQRTAFFLSAMRHFGLELQQSGRRLRYVTLEQRGNTQDFRGEVERAVAALHPQKLIVTQPGEWRVLDSLAETARTVDCELEVQEDEHFFVTVQEFGAWAGGRKSLVMEYFYRQQRKKLGYLMEGDQPEGGVWNLDHDNRQPFKSAPDVPAIYRPRPDSVTREVLQLVERRYPRHPGKLESFMWPVTRQQSLRALQRFVETRLPHFGTYEDAMWADEPFLYHSLLSPLLNVKLLNPRECVAAAIQAYQLGRAPFNGVEGFVRQLIGWREFIRGVYWTEGRDYRDRNGLNQHGALPRFYYSGETEMRCLQQSLQPVLNHAWSHHIPRLMVLANFALISGVHPRAMGDWFFEMYADAVDWATTPNTIGMGMHADHAVVGTKPYAASGKYIDRMSNYCGQCVFDKHRRLPDDAGARPCPFNTFYWDFLLRTRDLFRHNPRMAMMQKNADRIPDDEQRQIAAHAGKLRIEFGIESEHAPSE